MDEETIEESTDSANPTTQMLEMLKAENDKLRQQIEQFDKGVAEKAALFDKYYSDIVRPSEPVITQDTKQPEMAPIPELETPAVPEIDIDKLDFTIGVENKERK